MNLLTICPLIILAAVDARPVEHETRCRCGHTEHTVRAVETVLQLIDDTVVQYSWVAYSCINAFNDVMCVGPTELQLAKRKETNYTGRGCYIVSFVPPYCCAILGLGITRFS